MCVCECECVCMCVCVCDCCQIPWVLGSLILLAMSTFSPVGLLSSNDMRMCACVCVCVCGWNELEVCIMLAYPHNYQFVLCYASAIHKHTHPQTI